MTVQICVQIFVVSCVAPNTTIWKIFIRSAAIEWSVSRAIQRTVEGLLRADSDERSVSSDNNQLYVQLWRCCEPLQSIGMVSFFDFCSCHHRSSAAAMSMAIPSENQL